mgnify:CR=1 FL=1
MKKHVLILLLCLLITPAYGAEIIQNVSSKILCPMTKISDGATLTTGTVNLLIQRASDTYYWTGAAWQVGSSNLAMTHQHDGIWTYTTTLDTAGDMWLSCQDTTPSVYRISWSQTVYPEDRIIVADNVGINWADVSNPTTTQNLSGTSVLISDGTGAGQIDTLSGAIVNVDTCDVSTSVTLAATTHTGAVIPTVTTVTNAVTLPTIPADWITAAGVAAGAITVSEAPNLDAAISSRSTFNATTDAVDLDFTLACPVTPTAGTVGDACKTSADSTAQTGDIYPLASTEIADIKAKTDLIPADPADASDIAALLSPIQADTNDMQTRLPAVLVGGKMDSDMTAISGDTVAADNNESEHNGTGYMGSGIAVSPTTDADSSLNFWRTIEITEPGIITANDDHIGKYLWCGKEFSEIMKTVQGATDTITIDPAEPFGTAQTSGTCYIK